MNGFYVFIVLYVRKLGSYLEIMCIFFCIFLEFSIKDSLNVGIWREIFKCYDVDIFEIYKLKIFLFIFFV